MICSLVKRLSLLALVALLVSGAATALTAANTVPASHSGRLTDTITADKLKPAACAGITLTNVVTGSGIVPGTSANDLILGSAGADILGNQNAGQDSDCCLGGGGINIYRSSCVVHVP